MQIIQPHYHAIARTAQDYERMAMSGVVAVCEPAFGPGLTVVILKPLLIISHRFPNSSLPVQLNLASVIFVGSPLIQRKLRTKN